jgi:hypothetical protein
MFKGPLMTRLVIPLQAILLCWSWGCRELSILQPRMDLSRIGSEWDPGREFRTLLL